MSRGDDKFEFGKRLKKYKTNRSPRDIVFSCLSIYYKIKSISLAYSPKKA